MKAIILAAGEGTRLRPITYNIPKPMVKVNGKPILEHTFKELPDEIDQVILVVGYLKEHIVDYFGKKHQGRKITYVKQPERRGTGNALFQCKHLIEENEKFLVLNGDDLYKKEDLEKLTKKGLAILVKETDEPEKFGIVTCDQNGNVSEIIEKPEGLKKGLANTGAFVLDARIFDYKPVKITETEYGLPQTVTKMAQDHPVKIVRASFWIPVGYPQDIKQANNKLNNS